MLAEVTLIYKNIANGLSVDDPLAMLFFLERQTHGEVECEVAA